MHRITTIAAFQEFTSAFKETDAYRNPLLFAIGGVVRTRDGVAASVRYPVVNGYMQNTGTAALLMKILGIQPKGVQNVLLTKRQLQEMLYFFKPFENDGVNHPNIQVLKMAENLYHDKGINSPGDAVASFIFDADSPVLGVEDATLRLYGRSLSLYQAHDSHLSEILTKLPCVIWENDVPINQDSIDEDLLSAAFGGKVFAPNMASKVPLLIHRINIGKLGRTTPRLNTARLGTYVDEGGNIRHIWFPGRFSGCTLYFIYGYPEDTFKTRHIAGLFLSYFLYFSVFSHILSKKYSLTPDSMTRTTPHILILSGPSGVGKTTVWEELHTRYSDRLEKIITTTTRAKREGEIEGKHYYFLSREEFQSRIDSGDMIEYALVHGNYYGSTFQELSRIVELGKYPLYIVDPQGMVHLKPLLQHRRYTVQTFFLLPPSVEELRNRLSGRGTEKSDHLELRLANALVEMEEQDFYDHKIINTTLEETLEILASVIFSK